MGIRYQAYNRRYRAKMVSFFPMPVAISGLLALAICIGGVGMWSLGHMSWGIVALFFGVSGLSLSLLYWAFLSNKALLTTYLQGYRIKRTPDNVGGVK